MSRESAMSALTGVAAPSSTQPISPPLTTHSPGLAATPPAQAGAPAAGTAPNRSDPFAHIAKKEAEIVKERLELKKQKEEASIVLQKQKEFEELKVKDPVAAMRMMGFSETDIFNYMAAQEKPELTPEEKVALAAKEATEASLTEWEKKQADAEQAKRDASDKSIIAEFKTEITNTIEADKVKYAHCAHNGPVAEQMIYNLAVQISKESNGTDTISKLELMDLVEEQLKYEYEEAKKVFEAKKEEVEPVAKTPERTRTITPGTPADPQKPTITKTRTLSNAATASVASTVVRRNETREQKKERLAGYLREGKLG
jgi:hypothetical protein